MTAACSLPPGALSKQQPLPLRSTILAADGTVLAHLAGGGDCVAEARSELNVEGHSPPREPALKSASHPLWIERYDRWVKNRLNPLLARLCGENRAPLRADQMPQVIKDAVIAVEDSRFWKHGALDTRGLLRALVTNVQAGHVSQGGSTITQQLAKLMFTDPDEKRTLKTKIHELRYAIALEQRFPKEEILTMYLNRAYFGALAYGVAAASETYFNKPARKLDLPEAAMLAGMVKEPTTLDPFKPKNRHKAVERRNVVLQRMLEESMITPEAAHTAMHKQLVLQQSAPTCRRDRFPYFVHYIERSFVEDPNFGATRLQRAEKLFRGGLTIKTTIDPVLQRDAEAAVRAGTHSLYSNPDAALVAVDPKTGQIKAMATTQDDFCGDPFSLAWQGRPIPGSTFKPFDLGAALEQGISPESRYSGMQHNLRGKYGFLKEQKNDDHDYGLVTLRYGMQQSINAVYMRLVLDVGPDNVADFAHRAGITANLKCASAGGYLEVSCPSIGIGQVNVSPLEMAGAYSTFANNGLHMPTHGVAEVVDARGRKTFDDKKVKGQQTIDPNVAYTITNVLQTVACCGTARPANIGRPMAAKTGTSDAHKDVWLMGYTPDLVTAVWVGHRRPQSLGGHAWGATVAAPIWRTFMGKAHANIPVHDFLNPPGVLDLHFHNNTTGAKCGKGAGSSGPGATGSSIVCPTGTTTPTPTATGTATGGSGGGGKPKPRPHPKPPPHPRPSPTPTHTLPPPSPTPTESEPGGGGQHRHD
jgi:penicillin-binding protein 1A